MKFNSIQFISNIIKSIRTKNCTRLLKQIKEDFTIDGQGSQK